MRSRSDVVRDYGGVSASDRRAQRRARLLAAGRRCWGSSGLGAVTVRGVCAEAGLTARYFYEHFSDRDALILAIGDDARDHLLSVMVHAGLTASGSGTEKLTGALRAFLDAIADDPDLMRIATISPADNPGLLDRRRHMLNMIADLVVEHAPAAFTTDLDADHLRRAALFAVGGVNQLIEGWLDGSISMPIADLAAECARSCVAVLLNDAPTTR